MYSDMSSRTMRVIIVEQEFRKRASQFRFADAGGPHEYERADRAIRIREAGTAAANGVGDSFEGVFLAHDALPQALFHVHQFFDFAFEQAANRNTGPLADDAGDFFFAHFFFQN